MATERISSDRISSERTTSDRSSSEKLTNGRPKPESDKKPAEKDKNREKTIEDKLSLDKQSDKSEQKLNGGEAKGEAKLPVKKLAKKHSGMNGESAERKPTKKTGDETAEQKMDKAKCKNLKKEDGDEVDGLKNGRTNNFASYISSKPEENGGSQECNGSGDDAPKTRQNRLYDVTTSPRLNRASITSQSNAGTSTTTTNNSNNSPTAASSSSATLSAAKTLAAARASIDRDLNEDGRMSSTPVKHHHQGLNGLKNIGNTCFMNSVIQCLSNTRFLLEYLRKDLYVNDINTTISSMKGALIKAFSQVIKELWSEDPGDRVVNTVSLKSQIQRFAPRFMGYAQQDAQEFLRYLLEGLHEDVNRVASKPAPILTEIDEKLSDAEKSTESWQRYLRMDNSKIVDIFVGQLKSTLRCTHCGHCSVTFDPFWDLSLPIPQKAGPVRLSQCLEYFTREETLDGDEKPTCSKCEERRKCTKSFSIQKFPKILVIHLKRFSPTERYRGKLSVTVDFPLEGLDMRAYAADNDSDCRYNLYAISNHSGTTYSGHYTAYCRHPYSHTWHMYNDSRVSPISSSSIVSGEAYVLFYEQDTKKSHL